MTNNDNQQLCCVLQTWCDRNDIPMKYFITQLNLTNASSLTYSLAPEIEMPIPWPRGIWTDADIHSAPDGRFDAATRDELQKQWVLIEPIEPELPEIVGEFSSMPIPPLFSAAMRDLIVAHDPSLCDFVPVTKWDRRNNRLCESKTYFFAALRIQADVWDRTRTEIRTLGVHGGGQHKGEPFFLAVPPYHLDQKRVQGLWLWRDKVTGAAMCSQAFRKAVEGVGRTGLGYLPTVLTNAPSR